MSRKSTFKQRKARAALHTSSWVPWPFWGLLGIAGACFFWFVAMSLHLPGWVSNGLIARLDRMLHDPIGLLYAGWGSVALGAFGSMLAIKRKQVRSRLLDRQRGIEDIRAMTWQQFELLVGEYYRRVGFQVSETGQGGADGGVDLVLRRRQEKVLVQCKQWRTVSVGASVVREMFGLMNHHGATRVAIVCCGHFTADARAFAEGKPFDLIDGPRLFAMIQVVQN